MPLANVQATAGTTVAQVTYTAPSATNNLGTVVPFMTNNGLNTGSFFPVGLTETIYTFGNAGAQSTCTVYIFVRGEYVSQSDDIHDKMNWSTSYRIIQD